jgi:hypothetical protein
MLQQMTSHSQQVHRSPAGFQRTAEWHAARAAFLRWLGDPKARYLAKHHAILAKLIERRRRRAAGCEVDR